jgi:hypothetical protein
VQYFYYSTISLQNIKILYSVVTSEARVNDEYTDKIKAFVLHDDGWWNNIPTAGYSLPIVDDFGLLTSVLPCTVFQVANVG